MNYRLIVKDQATQDLRQLANYILVIFGRLGET